LALLAALLVALSVRPAFADDLVARSRSHYEAGRALYDLGRYSEARVEFAAGYALVHDPFFLINLGQCYRKLRQPAEARAIFEQFLKVAPAGDPYRRQVKEILAEIDRDVTVVPARSRRPIATAPILNRPIATEPLVAPATRSFTRRHWWLFPVGAAVLTGLGVGLYFALRPPPVDCGAVRFGCIYPP
jgi:tetratricopeptide (TPR) repeat protein